MRKCITLMLAASICLVPMFTAFAQTQHEDEKQIETVSELKSEIKQMNKDGKITTDERKQIIQKASPEVLENYTDSVIEKSFKAIENAQINPDKIMKDVGGTSYGKATIAVDETTKATIQFEDGEEQGVLDKILDANSVYAASNGESLWKNYGNRYYTAKVSVQCGIGVANLTLENHYKVSASGITERYGVTGVSGVSLLGTTKAGGAKIGTKYAKSKDKSASMYATYDINVGVKGVLYGQFTRKLTTKVKYIKLDKKNKKLKVQHNWSVKSL